MAETIDFSRRNTPEGLPGVLIEYAEDGKITRTPVTTHSLREVYTDEEPNVTQDTGEQA